jgi:hypothetical protein
MKIENISDSSGYQSPILFGEDGFPVLLIFLHIYLLTLISSKKHEYRKLLFS